MNNRRSNIFVNSTNTSFEAEITTDDTNKVVCRGACVLTDSNQIAGERYIKGIDLKVDILFDGMTQWDSNRYSLQFAVVPKGTEPRNLSPDELNFCTFPMTVDTVYVTTLSEARQNGVKVDGVNKGVPKGYFLVCYLWENYNNSERYITQFGANLVKISGRVNISF